MNEIQIKKRAFNKIRKTLEAALDQLGELEPGDDFEEQYFKLVRDYDSLEKKYKYIRKEYRKLKKIK